MRRALAPLATIALLAACANADQPAAPVPQDTREAPRNLIFMVGDGMGFAQVSALRLYLDDPATPAIDRLFMDGLLTGAVETSALEPPWVVTDSASAATAYATGEDTVNGAIAQGPDGKRLETLLEKARRAGKAVGVAVTSELTHATPAAFLTHAASRQDVELIADQLLDNRVAGRPVADVLLGGGLADLQREDRDLLAEFEAAGYRVVRDRAGLSDAEGSDPIIGVFAEDGLPRAWDRPDTIPSLAEMTRFALASLAADPEGFVLVVEGSQIDWAGHDNDIVGVISEMEDFQEAIRAAVSFAREAGDTLVVVTADHETGGLSLAAEKHYFWDGQVLRGVRRTPLAMAQEFVAGSEPLAQLLSRHVPFELEPAERVRLDAVDHDELGIDEDPWAAIEAVAAVLREFFDARTGTGWSTGAHTASDVPLYAYGPGSDAFCGTQANEIVGRRLAAALLGDD